MNEYKWIKQHPLSACSVGDIETIEDEARVAELKEGKYITPYDPDTDTVEEVDTVKELQDVSDKYFNLKTNYEAIQRTTDALSNSISEYQKEIEILKAENEELKKENQALVEEINAAEVANKAKTVGPKVDK